MSAVQVDRLELCEARCRRLEEIDRRRAKSLFKAWSRTKMARLQLAAERERRLEAEANARKFHAMLLQERIRKL